jgi:hypothetical protein
MISNESNKIKSIQKKFYKNLLFLLLGLIISVYCFWFLYVTSSDQERQILAFSEFSIKREIQLKKVKNTLRASYLADKFWHQISQKQNLSNNGLDFPQASLILTDAIVKNNLYLQSTITSTPQQDLTNIKFNTEKTIVGSSINIDLYGASDSQIYGFINDIEENMPGFLKITNFEIILLDKNIQKVIDNLRKNKLDILINAKIKAEWYDFKPSQSN